MFNLQWGSIDQGWAGLMQALAALVTGGLAVGAALVVGRAQVRITARQTKIQAQQLLLQDGQLRAQVFDRRFAIYEDVSQFLVRGLNNNFQIDRELEDKMLLAMSRASFLFGAEIREIINEAWAATCNIVALQQAARAAPHLLSAERIGEQARAYREAQAEVQAVYDRLPATFAREISFNWLPPKPDGV